MAGNLPAWFVHALNEEVDQLGQQMYQATRGAVREKSGVVGKTYPFNMLAQTAMRTPVRDELTVYENPTMSKRRCSIVDRGLALLIDDFDRVKTPADIDSAFKTAMASARNREKDFITIAQAVGNATTINESAAGGDGTTATVALPTTGGPLAANIGSTIPVSASGLTVTKIVQAAEILNTAGAPMEDRFFFYSPHAMTNMLNNSVVTSSDYNTIKALVQGGFPMDQTWMGFHWRMVMGHRDPAAPTTSQILPLSGTTRTCVAWQKMGVGVAYGLESDISVNEAPHAWNNTQIVMKLSMGAVRIQDPFVVAVLIDETL